MGVELSVTITLFMDCTFVLCSNQKQIVERNTINMQNIRRIYLRFTETNAGISYNQNTMDSIDSLISMVGTGSHEFQVDTQVSASDESAQKFQELLQVMMLSSHMNESSSSSSEGVGSIFGSDMFMMPLVMNLMEQLMGMQLRDGLGEETPMEAAALIQINQFEAELQVGGDGINANCGPASLAMAMRALGSAPYYASMNGSLVDYARTLMIDESSRDGVDSNGSRVEWEHNAYTSLSEIAKGAVKAGLSTNRLSPSSTSIIRAIQSGAKVVVSGTFRGKNPLPWTGDTERDYNRSPGGATEHFILVSGYDERSGKLIINDPARQTPLSVYPFQLDRFMEGNEGALAIYR